MVCLCNLVVVAICVYTKDIICYGIYRLPTHTINLLLHQMCAIQLVVVMLAVQSIIFDIFL